MQPAQDLNVKAEQGAKWLALQWLIAIVITGFSVAILAIGIASSDLVPEFIGCGFLIVSIGMLYAAIRATLGMRAYGDVRLLLEHPAPTVGGRLVGTVSAAAPALVGRTLQAALVCTQFEFTAMSKNPRQMELWRGRHDFPLQAGATGAAARVSFDLPPDRPPSADRPVEGSPAGTRDTWCKWSLEVKVQTPGVDLVRTYPIIVGSALAHGEAAAFAAAPASHATVQAPPPASKPAVPTLGSVLQQASLVDMGSDEPSEDASSTWVLIAANTVPLAGVALWGWSVHDIVFLYWMENVVIGLFNLLRMLFAAPASGPGEAPEFVALLTAKLGLMGFFSLHYGLFCFVHGQFLANLFPEPGEPGTDLFSAVHAALHETGMSLALAAIAASRAYSFVRNYLGRGEYRGIELPKLMMQPYKRIVVTHLFIIFGGFLLTFAHAQALALLLFIGLKIGFDVYHHRKERKTIGD